MLSNTHSSLRTAGLILLSIVCVTAGCGQSDKPELGQVTGIVSLDGQPLPDALVFFSPEEGGRTSVGRTNTSGEYQLSYIGADPGAKVGKHAVRITTSQEASDPKTGRTIHTPEKVPDRYNSHSELSHNVEPGENKIDLDLQSK